MSSAAEVGERGILRALLGLWRRPDDPDIAIGPGDDAAVVRLHHNAVMTVDSIVAGQDWLVDTTPPDAVGHRAAAVNLSDLAAMGARPRYLLVALELNSHDDVDDLLEAALGLAALCDPLQVRVIGGDIGIGAGPQRWTVTAIGERSGQVLTRSAARPGHRVWLAGDVGRASLGLHALLHGRADPCLQPHIEAHLRPQPLTAVGLRLAALSEPIGAIDISDGLWLDASRLAEASGCGLRLQLPRPDWVSPICEARCNEIGWDWRQGCATGGDDYALLLTAPWGLDLATYLADHCRTVPIGIVEAGEGVQLDVESQRLIGPPRGYLHGAKALGLAAESASRHRATMAVAALILSQPHLVEDGADR